MRLSGIYKIQSQIKPERIYIGSAINIGKRWQRHLGQLRNKKHHSKKLQNHFSKYGEIDLEFSLLLSCEKQDLIKIEQYFIDSYNPYFNNCKIAGSSLGFNHSQETKDKLSEMGKGLKHNYPKTRIPMSLNTRNKISKANLGKKRSPETCMRISLSRHGLNNGLLRGWTGRHHSNETKEKIRKAHTGIKRGKYKKAI